MKSAVLRCVCLLCFSCMSRMQIDQRTVWALFCLECVYNVDLQTCVCRMNMGSTRLCQTGNWHMLQQCVHDQMIIQMIADVDFTVDINALLEAHVYIARPPQIDLNIDLDQNTVASTATHAWGCWLYLLKSFNKFKLPVQYITFILYVCIALVPVFCFDMPMALCQH